MARSSRAAFLAALDPAERRAALERLDDRQRRALRSHWRLWARPEQLPPPGDWATWLVMAGRGFGKTRAGAEWVRAVAENDPQARIALVGASLGEVRAVMVEGESGLMTLAPLRQRPRFEPSKHRLTWPSGAQATLFSAAEPESLRGPQHSHACRPGSEGNLRQRSQRAARCAGPPRDRRDHQHSARQPGRRPVVAGRFCPDRRLGRSGGQARRARGRELAVLHPG